MEHFFTIEEYPKVFDCIAHQAMSRVYIDAQLGVISLELLSCLIPLHQYGKLDELAILPTAPLHPKMDCIWMIKYVQGNGIKISGCRSKKGILIKGLVNSICVLRKLNRVDSIVFYKIWNVFRRWSEN